MAVPDVPAGCPYPLPIIPDAIQRGLCGNVLACADASFLMENGASRPHSVPVVVSARDPPQRLICHPRLDADPRVCVVGEQSITTIEISTDDQDFIPATPGRQEHALPDPIGNDLPVRRLLIGLLVIGSGLFRTPDQYPQHHRASTSTARARSRTSADSGPVPT